MHVTLVHAYCILHNRNAMLPYIHTHIRRAQRDAIAKNEQPQKASLTRRLQHASKVKKQVREIEQQKINARKSFFEEGIKLDQEAKQRYLATNIRMYDTYTLGLGTSKNTNNYLQVHCITLPQTRRSLASGSSPSCSRWPGSRWYLWRSCMAEGSVLILVCPTTCMHTRRPYACVYKVLHVGIEMGNC